MTFKEPEDEKDRLVEVSDKSKRGDGKIPFGEPSTGQSKEALANRLNLKGEILGILVSTNAIYVKMDAKEAYRLSRDKRVLYVEQGIEGTVAMTTQTDPGWGLDGLDEQAAELDDEYTYTATGAGTTIYVLDTGITLDDPDVAAEFGGRATMVWDANGGDGEDCQGHGTKVSSVIAGNTYGVAKGATLQIAKVSVDCTIAVNFNWAALAIDWLADNAPTGSIINLSSAISFGPGNCNNSAFHFAIENAITAAHDAGIIVVVAAGNDSCNTINFSPVRNPESFVVGATNNNFIDLDIDAKALISKTGWNISAFAPGFQVQAMDQFGNPATVDGTSFSAPYIAGIFAIGCEAAAPLCANATSAAPLYDALRGTGTLGTVTDNDGTPLTGAT